jgi:hypothetical protein
MCCYGPFSSSSARNSRGVQLGEAPRDVGVLGELRELAEHRQVLVADLEGRRHDEEEVVDGLVVDGVVVDAGRLAAERDAQPVDDEGAAVGMAMPRPMPVEPRFSRRFSILNRMPSLFSSSPSSAMSSAGSRPSSRPDVEGDGVSIEKFAAIP